jgi:uncharacterized protein
VHHWRILLDLDGTVAQNAGRRVAERHFGISVGADRIGEKLPDMLGLTQEQFWAWWHENQEEIYDQATLIPGANDVVRTLKKAGAFIAVITARRTTAEGVTAAWLQRHGIPYDTMIMSADDKVAAARTLGLNIGFEDDPHFAVPLADVMPMVLIENDKNRGLTLDHPQIHRVGGWTDALPLLRRLEMRTA